MRAIYNLKRKKRIRVKIPEENNQHRVIFQRGKKVNENFIATASPSTKKNEEETIALHVDDVIELIKKTDMHR